MADVHVYVTRPAGKEGAALEDIEGVLRKIKRTVEETGYKVSRLSVRTTFADERHLWDI